MEKASSWMMCISQAMWNHLVSGQQTWLGWFNPCAPPVQVTALPLSRGSLKIKCPFILGGSRELLTI